MPLTFPHPFAFRQPLTYACLTAKDVAAAGCENPNVLEIADCCIKGLDLKAEYEVSLDDSAIAAPLVTPPACPAQ